MNGQGTTQLMQWHKFSENRINQLQIELKRIAEAKNISEQNKSQLAGNIMEELQKEFLLCGAIREIRDEYIRTLFVASKFTPDKMNALGFTTQEDDAEQKIEGNKKEKGQKKTLQLQQRVQQENKQSSYDSMRQLIANAEQKLSHNDDGQIVAKKGKKSGATSR